MLVNSCRPVAVVNIPRVPVDQFTFSAAVRVAGVNQCVIKSESESGESAACRKDAEHAVKIRAKDAALEWPGHGVAPAAALGIRKAKRSRRPNSVMLICISGFVVG